MRSLTASSRRPWHDTETVIVYNEDHPVRKGLCLTVWTLYAAKHREKAKGNSRQKCEVNTFMCLLKKIHLVKNTSTLDREKAVSLLQRPYKGIKGRGFFYGDRCEQRHIKMTKQMFDFKKSNSKNRKMQGIFQGMSLIRSKLLTTVLQGLVVTGL